MKIKKYICAFAALLVVLSGCGGNDGVESQPGKVEQITAAQLYDKMEKKESFTLVFTQTTCSHCITFMKMLDEYLPDHNIVVYDMVLDLEANRDQVLKELETLFPDFTGTPDIYYVEHGSIKSRFWDEFQNDGLSETTFHKWAKDLDLLGKSK